MPLSTHVIDISFGAAAADVGIRLRRRQETAAWTDLAVGRTAADGGLTVWPGQLPHGVYRLEADLDGYYAPLGIQSFHPRAIVEFQIVDSSQDLQVCLLITPNSLLIFRGPRSENGTACA
ncbi:MAG: hydroxyisourate hydrolase [Catenulispora sp.]|nr:hydroxyisourate hydrolase [Catenulispora sp.]